MTRRKAVAEKVNLSQGRVVEVSGHGRAGGGGAATIAFEFRDSRCGHSNPARGGDRQRRQPDVILANVPFDTGAA